MNKKRTFIIPETFVEEEDRQRQLNKVFQKIKDFEEDPHRPSTSGASQSSTQPGATFNKTASAGGTGNGANAGFFAGANGSTSANAQYRSRENEFIGFKNIKENQMVSTHSNFTTGGYHGAKSYHIENSELLYKMLRFDNKLLRSMLEHNGFSHTESHEWNVLWSSSSCKSYLYEGLNEYQKINHFPQSYEITRKDRLCYNMVRM